MTQPVTATHGHLQNLSKLLWKFRNLKIHTMDFEERCGYVASSMLEEYVKTQANNLRLCPRSVNTGACAHHRACTAICSSVIQEHSLKNNSPCLSITRQNCSHMWTDTDTPRLRPYGFWVTSLIRLCLIFLLIKLDDIQGKPEFYFNGTLREPRVWHSWRPEPSNKTWHCQRSLTISDLT